MISPANQVTNSVPYLQTGTASAGIPVINANSGGFSPVGLSGLAPNIAASGFASPSAGAMQYPGMNSSSFLSKNTFDATSEINLFKQMIDMQGQKLYQAALQKGMVELQQQQAKAAQEKQKAAQEQAQQKQQEAQQQQQNAADKATADKAAAEEAKKKKKKK